MFGSQALETAIGLAAMFFVLATTASAITEIIARWLKKRAGDLEKGIVALLHGEGTKRKGFRDALKAIEDTSVWKAAVVAAGTTVRGKERVPSYLSAKMFADMMVEFLRPEPTAAAPNLSHFPNLERRLNALAAEGRHDIIALKSGLETWFDEAMARVSGAYKRWATAVLFVVGLAIAVGGNVSTIAVAQQLWQDPVTRATVTQASDRLLRDGADATQLANVADATAQLREMRLPVGWDAESARVWSDGAFGGIVSDLAGWLLTAVLVMLGAPFWFDVLSRLSTLRGAGARPVPAAQDDTSATRAPAAIGGAVLLGDQGEFATRIGLLKEVADEGAQPERSDDSAMRVVEPQPPATEPQPPAADPVRSRRPAWLRWIRWPARRRGARTPSPDHR